MVQPWTCQSVCFRELVNGPSRQRSTHLMHLARNVAALPASMRPGRVIHAQQHTLRCNITPPVGPAPPVDRSEWPPSCRSPAFGQVPRPAPAACACVQPAARCGCPTCSLPSTWMASWPAISVGTRTRVSSGAAQRQPGSMVQHGGHVRGAAAAPSRLLSCKPRIPRAVAVEGPVQQWAWQLPDQGSLCDAGFDPLGLGADPARLKWWVTTQQQQQQQQQHHSSINTQRVEPGSDLGRGCSLTAETHSIVSGPWRARLLVKLEVMSPAACLVCYLGSREGTKTARSSPQLPRRLQSARHVRRVAAC
jgi:hypothetical protein